MPSWIVPARSPPGPISTVGKITCGFRAARSPVALPRPSPPRDALGAGRGPSGALPPRADLDRRENHWRLPCFANTRDVDAAFIERVAVHDAVDLQHGRIRFARKRKNVRREIEARRIARETRRRIVLAGLDIVVTQRDVVRCIEVRIELAEEEFAVRVDDQVAEAAGVEVVLALHERGDCRGVRRARTRRVIDARRPVGRRAVGFLAVFLLAADKVEKLVVEDRPAEASAVLSLFEVLYVRTERSLADVIRIAPRSEHGSLNFIRS